MRFSILFATVMFFSSSAAFAQDVLDEFLDRVIEASSKPTCDDTQKALDKISDSDFKKAAHALNNLENQSLASDYLEKIEKISELGKRCPEVHDGYAKRLSLETLHDSMAPKQKGVVDDIYRFTSYCETAMSKSSCGKSADYMAKIPRETCDKAINAFKTISPNEIDNKVYSDISSKLEKIEKWSQSCKDFSIQYQTCLSSINWLPLNQLDPLFKWMDEAEKVIAKLPCSEFKNFRLTKLELDAYRAVSTLKPSQFSPSDREKIQVRMKKLYHQSTCPEARKAIDASIERIFSP